MRLNVDYARFRLRGYSSRTLPVWNVFGVEIVSIPDFVVKVAAGSRQSRCQDRCKNTRIDDFECTAKALFLAYGAQMDANHAAAHANGIHSWQGRAAYELFTSADYLTQAAIQLLAHGEERYFHEKLTSGLNRITGALYEGIRTSDTPEQFDFHSVYFPQVSDRR